MDINQTAHSLRLGKSLYTLKASGFFMLFFPEAFLAPNLPI